MWGWLKRLFPDKKPEVKCEICGDTIQFEHQYEWCPTCNDTWQMIGNTTEGFGWIHKGETDGPPDYAKIDKKVGVRMRWLSSGRKSPPTGERYYCVMELDHDDFEGTWSGMISSFGKDADVWIDAQAEFLTWEAPSHLLIKDVKFKLLEGRRVVAEGIVV